MAKRRPSGDGMVRKREDGRWEGRVVIGHKNDGSPIFRYVSAKTQKELLKKLHQSIEEYQGVNLSEESKMPLSQWLDRWLEEYAAPSVRPTTLEGYRGYINRNIKPYLGNRPVGKITREDVQKLYRELQRNGRQEYHPEHGHKLSGSTIRRIHGIFHEAMDAAVRENLIARNPTEGIALPKKKVAAKQVLNDAQLERFMEVIQEDRIWHDFFYTELTTGMRRGEICGLMWSDFDEMHGTLSVRRTLHIQKEENRMKKKSLALLVAGGLLCSTLMGCTRTYATDLMDGVKEGTPTEVQVQEETWVEMQDFSVKLLQATCDQEENTLVSPMSVLSALAMTANGARGETLAQMEDTLGGTVEQLNGALTGLGQEKDSPLYLANSIWFAEEGRITPNQDFLQINADYYRAGVFEAPFDQTTVTDINRWVKEHTHGMVEEILKEIPRDTVMYLINALAFEAEWENPYQKEDVWQQAFTNQAGKVQQVSMMHSEEQLYLRDDQTQGFVKYYQGGRYAFVALLPDKEISILDYVKGLDGQQLKALLDNPTSVPVAVTMPKFESEMEVDLQEVLKEMGMVLPFDSAQADFTDLGTSPGGNLYINEVLHKAYIEVEEKGTRGGAATAVGINCEAAPEEPEEQMVVTLDRPFVYLVVDTSSMLPVFMGTVLSV